MSTLGEGVLISTLWTKERELDMASDYFKSFQRSYWNYYLELEERMEATKKYVEFDLDNKNVYSSTYLMLMQAVCSEIDVVAKEIASHFSVDFQNDKGNKSINRWWYEIQDTLPKVVRTITFADSIERNPWDKFRVVKVITQRTNNQGQQIDVTNYNLQPKGQGITYATPKWWNAYNKVKHKRVDSDSDGMNYKKANLDNLTYAFAALYLLEFEYMKKIGTPEERVGCGRSILFGMGDLESNYISSLFMTEAD